MKVRFVNFETELYTVTAEKIYSTKPEKIVKYGDKIRIYKNYDWYIGHLDDTALKLESDEEWVAYLNFSDAQKKQIELRQEAIDKAFKTMCKAKDEYEELIKKFKDKPATQITEL